MKTTCYDLPVVGGDKHLLSFLTWPGTKSALEPPNPSLTNT